MEKTVVAVPEKDGEVNGRQEMCYITTHYSLTVLCKGFVVFFGGFPPQNHSQGLIQADFCNLVFCYILLKKIILKSSFR